MLRVSIGTQRSRPKSAQALLGQLGDTSWLGQLIAEIDFGLLFTILGIERLRKLDEDAAAVAPIGSVLNHDGVACSAGACEEIDDDERCTKGRPSDSSCTNTP